MTYFGCKCSNFGILVTLVGCPDASNCANSSGCAFFLWLRQFEPFANVLSQNGHEYGRKPVCRIKWFFNAFDLLYSLPQYWHLYFFWSECTTICIFNVRFVFNCKPQCGHTYVVSLCISSWVYKQKTKKLCNWETYSETKENDLSKHILLI